MHQFCFSVARWWMFKNILARSIWYIMQWTKSYFQFQYLYISIPTKLFASILRSLFRATRETCKFSKRWDILLITSPQARIGNWTILSIESLLIFKGKTLQWVVVKDNKNTAFQIFKRVYSGSRSLQWFTNTQISEHIHWIERA